MPHALYVILPDKTWEMLSEKVFRSKTNISKEVRAALSEYLTKRARKGKHEQGA